MGRLDGEQGDEGGRWRYAVVCLYVAMRNRTFAILDLGVPPSLFFLLSYHLIFYFFLFPFS